MSLYSIKKPKGQADFYSNKTPGNELIPLTIHDDIEILTSNIGRLHEGRSGSNKKSENEKSTGHDVS